ncbi:MAG: 4-oxalocrotonate tautomerase DmpI [Bacteroidota bacterium]
MPVINIDGPNLTKEQKAELVEALVTQSSKIMKIPEEAFVTIIRENEMDNIGNGKELLSDKMNKKK